MKYVGSFLISFDIVTRYKILNSHVDHFYIKLEH